ncbi:MAG: FHIPEP family type III secretion protein [Treponema sp.]|nr:FHIPEP family type III secretion protein [Treponema sp.]
MILFFPLPAVILEGLLVLNLVFVSLLLTITLHFKKTADFPLFPTALFVLLIFNLILHISITRHILIKRAVFDGQVISMITSFISGSNGLINLVVNGIIFLAFLLVVAIAVKGAVRISEVAARFSLDSMPARQMTIDTEYNSGTITEEESIVQKTTLQREFDFFVALDGVSKFISGGFIVVIFITLVSIIGGIIIGTKLHNEDIIAKANIYVPLSITAGFFAQLPIFLESIVVWVIVSRIGSK